jgi:hypothetical protein
MTANNGNTASGAGSFAIGSQNVASGDYSFATGERESYATAHSSIAHGSRGKAYLRGQIVQSNTTYNYNNHAPYYGIAQASTLVAQTTNQSLLSGGTVSLSIDGSGTTNLIIPDGNNRAWNATIETVAIVTAISGTATGVSVGNSFLQNDTVLFKRVGGTSSVVGSSNNLLISDDALSTASMNYSAGASQELALTFQAPTFAGGGTVTFRVVSKVSLVEVAY